MLRSCLSALLVALPFSHALAGQSTPATPSSAELQVQRADKLAQPFLRHAEWHLDLQSAQRAAAREGKLILVHCTRSYTPCGTSIRCEREVLASPEFVAFARSIVLLVHVTAHLDEEEDRRLPAWRGSGFPHHVVLDATGRVLGTHESHRQKSVAAFEELVAAARDFLAIEATTERSEQSLRRQRLQVGLAAGSLTLVEARDLMADSGTWSPAEAIDIASLITDLEIAATLATVDRTNPTAQQETGRVFALMYRLGKRPQARNAMRDFYGAVLLNQEVAERPDLELCRAALAALEERFAGERGYSAFLKDRRQKLVELEAKSAAVAPAGVQGATLPSVQPTKPSVQPTKPSVQPTQPSVQPTKNGAGGGT